MSPQEQSLMGVFALVGLAIVSYIAIQIKEAFDDWRERRREHRARVVETKIIERFLRIKLGLTSLDCATAGSRLYKVVFEATFHNSDGIRRSHRHEIGLVSAQEKNWCHLFRAMLEARMFEKTGSTDLSRVTPENLAIFLGLMQFPEPTEELSFGNEPRLPIKQFLESLSSPN